MTEPPSFHAYGPAARAHFEEHGYVVFAPVFSARECQELNTRLDALLAGYASEQRMEIADYLALISQWRDLWRCDAAFAQILADPRLHQLAAQLLGRRGARLLHDHVIAKPAGHSGTVPWHQDYPYWPVEPAQGLSCWIPLEEVGPAGGCLEVIAGSHRLGERPPVDFISDAHAELDQSPQRVLLPVPAGGVVVLHSLTWHRTGPNLAGGQRRAYITLWLPPDARYAPQHAAWHPTNEHVSVPAGAVLNDDWFPRFGAMDQDHDAAAPPLKEPTARDVAGALSMFSASQTIADQLREILRRANLAVPGGGIGTLLRSADARAAVLAECLRAEIVAAESEPEVREVLQQLLQCSEAYARHRARNVYNDVYVRWWRLAGARWAVKLAESAPTGSG